LWRSFRSYSKRDGQQCDRRKTKTSIPEGHAGQRVRRWP
jgi:hypothetical protein